MECMQIKQDGKSNQEESGDWEKMEARIHTFQKNRKTNLKIYAKDIDSKNTTKARKIGEPTK